MKYKIIRTELKNFNRKHFFVDKDKNEYVKDMLERVWEEALKEKDEYVKDMLEKVWEAATEEALNEGEDEIPQ